MAQAILTKSARKPIAFKTQRVRKSQENTAPVENLEAELGRKLTRILRSSDKQAIVAATFIVKKIFANLIPETRRSA